MKIELSHDILAQKVYERVSLEDKRLREVERLIRERYAFYQGEPKLGQEEVDFVRPYLGKVDLSAEERRFVEGSRKRIAAKRRRRLLTIAAFILAIIGGLSAYSIILNGKNAQIEKERDRAEIARNEAEAAQRATQEALEEVRAQREKAMFEKARANTLKNLAQIEANRAARSAEEARLEAIKADSAAKVAIENEKVADSLRIVADDKRQEALLLKQVAEQKARAANLLTAQSLANQSLKIRDPDEESLKLKRILAREAYRIHQTFRVDSTGREWASLYDPQIYNALYDALAIRDRSVNQVALKARQQPRFQVRSLERHGDKLYALTSGGNVLEWTWDGQALVGEKLLVKGAQDDVYFAQAIADQELVSLGVMRGPQRFDRLSSDSLLQVMRMQGNTVDVLLLEPGSQRMIIGQHLPGEQTVLFPRRFPGKRDTLSGHLVELVIAAQGGWMAARDRQGYLYAYRLRSMDPFQIDTLGCLSTDRHSTLQFCPQNVSEKQAQLAVGREDGITALYQLQSTGAQAVTLKETLRGHSAQISSLSFDETGRFLATASFDGTIQVWDLQDEKHQRFGPLAINVPGGLLQSLSFVPQDEVLVSGDNQGTIRQWPIDAHYWYQKLEAEVPVNQPSYRFTSEEVTRYLGTKEELESSDLLLALPEYNP